MSKKTETLHIAALAVLLMLALFLMIAIAYARDSGAKTLSLSSGGDVKVRQAATQTLTPTSTATMQPTATQTMTNDNIEYAAVITGLPYTISQPLAPTTRSVDDPQPRCWTTYFTNTIWFQYTPAVDQRVMFDAVNSDNDTNPQLAVFTGVPGSLVERGCSRWANNEGIDLTLSAGERYYIMGAKHGWTPATTEQFTLSVDVVPPVPNDELVDAIQIPSLPFSFRENIYAATSSPSDPAMSCGSYVSFRIYNNSIWFQYIAPADQTVMLNTDASEFSPVIAVYTGTQGSLTEQACYEAGADTRATFSAQAGVQYSIVIAKNDRDPLAIFDDLILDSFAIATAANDDIANATVISGLPFEETIDVYGATTAPTDPKLRQYCDSFWSYSYPNTVWYRYVPAADQTLNIATDGSGYRTIFGVYTGSESSLSQYACSDDPYQSIRVQAGVTYYVMIASADNYDLLPLDQPTPLHVRFDLPPISNDLIEDATVVDSFPFMIEQNVYGSSLTPNDPTGCTTNFQSNSVWFTYTPAQNQPVLLDTADSDYYAAIKVYTLGAGGALVEQECAYDFVGMQAQAGATYFIMVSRSEAPPSLQPTDKLRLRITAPVVSNDLLESPIIIPSDGVSYTHTQDVARSSITMNDPKLTSGDCRSSIIYSLNRPNTVWYQYTASTTQTLLIDTSGSDYPTYLELPYLGICGNNLRTFQAQAGTTYLIKVAYNKPSGGNRPLSQPTLLRLTLRPTIANDIQADALLINTTPFTYTENVTDATVDASEPYSNGCGTYTQSVWFKYEPADNRTVLIDTSGSNYDAMLGLHMSTAYYGCTPMDMDRSMPAQFTLNALAGQTYYIVVMNLSQTPAPDPAILQLSITDTINSDLRENARVIPSSALIYRDVQDLGNVESISPTSHAGCSSYSGPNSVWYRYTAPLHMRVTFSNLVTRSYILTNLYSGEMNPLACAQGWAYSPATVTFTALAGKSYYILVGADTNIVYVTNPWLNQLTFSASVIAQPTILGPSGVTASTKPEFTWIPLAGVEQYELSLSTGGGSPSIFTIAAAANCSDTLCSFTPSDDLALGQYEWSLRGWNSQIGYTLSSYLLTFEIVPNTPPTISDIGDQQTKINLPTDAIPFTIDDSQTAATSLTLTGTSSNTALVPNSNIIFGGSGVDRTVTITPAANQLGTALITVVVHDGNNGTASDTFLLSVTSGPPTLLHFESDAGEIIRTGGWKQQTTPAGASGGSYLLNTSPDDTLLLYFTGTGVDVFYVGGPAFGQMVVEVDGVVNQVVTSTAFDYTFNRSIVIAGLADGAHTLRIRAIGVIGVDAFDITSTSQAILPPVLFPEIEPTIPPPILPLPTLPPPLTLPVYATMDDGAPDWKASSGWALQSQAAYGSGLGWQTAATGAIEVLRWDRQLDLRSIPPTQIVQLTFQSLLVTSHSSATVQISTDGINWTPLILVSPSSSWNPVVVDLSADRGQLIRLQFVWQRAGGSEGQPLDTWFIDSVRVEAVMPPADEPPVATNIPVPTIEIIPTLQPPLETPIPPPEVTQPS